MNGMIPFLEAAPDWTGKDPTTQQKRLGWLRDKALESNPNTEWLERNRTA